MGTEKNLGELEGNPDMTNTQLTLPSLDRLQIKII